MGKILQRVWFIGMILGMIGCILSNWNLKALFREDPESEEAQEMREWLGLEEDETWDANYFNLEEANRYLSQL